MDVLDYIVQAILSAYILMFLLRFWLQLARASFPNQLSQFVVQVTNPLTRPVRRFIPGWRGMDLSTLLIAYLLTAAGITLRILMLSGSLPQLPQLFYAALVNLVTQFVYVLMFALIGYVVFSWFAPGHPVAGVLHQLSAPLLRPIRRVIPPVAGLDLSVWIALIGLGALLRLVAKF